MARRIVSLIICLSFIFQQTGFAQAATVELNLAGHLARLNNSLTLGTFRPVHLRYFSYDLHNNNFKVLLDKGSEKNLSQAKLEDSTKELLKYFLIGVTLPDNTFWVNLRPDSPDQIIEDVLTKTDIGKIMLETDLQLKKDTAAFTSPQTIEGKEYWDKLYKKAEEIYGTDTVTIPTITRPWIVPNEVIVREAEGSAYIYKATLKVMLEADYIKSSNTHLNTVDYSFKDKRSKALNEYSTQLIRELIIPKLTKEVNTSKNYAALRQVFYSLVLSRWFKLRFAGKTGTYPSLIDKQDLTNLTSTQSWDKSTYFNAYKKSFAEGEYNIKETHYTPTGQVIRSYFSGGVQMIIPQNGLGGVGDIAGNLSSTLALRAGSAVGNVALSPVTGVSGSPVQIRTDFTVPEGQKPDFFTAVRHEYRISELFAKPVNIIPNAVIDAVKAKLDQDKAEGKILSAMVNDFGANEIDIQVTHRYGELNAAVERLIMEAMKAGCLKAQELGLLRKDIDINVMDLRMLAKSLRMKHRTHSITERGAEPVVIGKIIGAGIGAANIKLYHQFFIPGSTPQRKLGYLPKVASEKKAGVRGFRAIVRKTEDVLKGNYDGPVWEFENCAAGWVGDKYYPSVDEREELMAVASQPNDYLITAVYPVEGSKLPSTEPLVSVVYQPVYGEEGNLRTLDPTFIFRSQSGADAVGGIARIIYDVNFVPGGPNGENYVVTRPATLEEARKAPRKGTAHAVVYGYQSEGIGKIPWETGEVVDHVAINPPAVAYQRKLAEQLAKVMITHENDQPYLTPFAAEARVAPVREAQSHLFQRAPKETEVDPLMEHLEAKVAKGEYASATDDKADMGGSFGHNFTPAYMLGIDRATIIEAIENGTLSDGNIIGYLDKGQLAKGIIMSVGDDSHMLMFGDKSPNSQTSHQLSFIAFTRGYLASMIGNTDKFDPSAKFDKSLAKKPYGRGQDFTGKEAKAAIEHPYFYSHFNERFFKILKEVMPPDYMQMVKNMEKGWRYWKSTQSEGITLEKPFSGNVSQQGIGSARYLVDIAGGEREFGILAGDKMGPAALNRILREAGDMALAAGEFKDGLVYEIQDAKAYDEHGNIPVEELPRMFIDIEESIPALKKVSDQDFVRSCYKDGWLRSDLSDSKKEDLARLLKESGYVPNKRIFLDAVQDKKAIDIYLADSDRFNVKQIWGKSKPGWDINNPQDYLGKPMLGSSITKLGILAGGEYIGKDDPVMIGHMKLMKHVYEFLRTEPLIIQGDMNGSHWLAAIPTAFKYLVANAESHPILGGWVYALSEDGKTIAGIKDVFDNKAYVKTRSWLFEFNHKFQKAQLGGQFEPYGTNRRTVEASYPLAKLLNAIEAEDSPFLVKNKPVESRATRPIGTLGTRVELFDRATRIAVSPTASSAVEAAKPKVAINGFGRIGRLFLKAFLENPDNKFEIVAINDLAPIETLAHLFRYDSTFGRFKGEVKIEEGNILVINGKRIQVFSEKDPRQLPWGGLGVEIVIEATGKFTTREGASQHLAAGAKKVVLTAPGKNEDVTVVLGVNENKYKPEKHQIISNASCTTNALAPVVKVLDKAFGVKYGGMVTVHAVTLDQRLLDTEHKDPRRARSAFNMIPTTTGAAKAVGKVITRLEGKLGGFSLRIPTPNVSVISLNLVLKKKVTAEDINAVLKKAAEEGALGKYLGYTTEQLVSSDFLGNPKSGIVDAPFTNVIGEKFAQVLIWYDNEWGYSSRTVDLVNYMIGKETPKSKSASSAVGAVDSNAVNTAGSPMLPGKAGGIDFRKQAMASVTAYKPMGSFVGLDAKLPQMSAAALAKFDLDKVASHIESMLSAKILFDETIIMEYMAASIAKGELAKRKSDVVTWLAKLGMLQEELDCCQESSPQYRQALVLVEKYAAI